MAASTALTRKVGPLPVWAWAVILGGTIGAIILIRNRGQSSSGTAQTTDATDGSTPYIDPTTGLPYAGDFGGGGGSTTATAPSIAQEVSDVSSLAEALQGLGIGGGSSPGLIALAPGASYYDPTTGQVVEGDASQAVAGMSATATKKAAAPAHKSTPLERAKKAVLSGRIGPVNRNRLRKAGYSDAQINYHLNRKTALGHPAKHKPKPKPHHAVHAAPSHPNQHRTAAPPHHAPAPHPRHRQRHHR